MSQEWWEETPNNGSAWWQATMKNTHAACPAWFADQAHFSTNAWSETETVTKLLILSGGHKIPISILKNAGYLANKAAAVGLLSHVYCGSVFLTSMGDAFYQVHHDGEHIGSAIWDSSYAWYVSKEKGVENFLINVSNCWENR